MDSDSQMSFAELGRIWPYAAAATVLLLLLAIILSLGITEALYFSLERHPVQVPYHLVMYVGFVGASVLSSIVGIRATLSLKKLHDNRHSISIELVVRHLINLMRIFLTTSALVLIWLLGLAFLPRF